MNVCVFCMVTTDEVFCPSCRDYKGLMPIQDAEKYLDEDLSDLY